MNPRDAPQELEDPLLAAGAPFGISYLFPYQRLVISNVMEACAAVPETTAATGSAEDRVRRQIVVLPTGAGKTLCFQLPAAMLPGLTIVIYPLLSLMADQVRRAEGAGLHCSVLRGGQSADERCSLWQNLGRGRIQLLLTNPEMLVQERVLQRLVRQTVSHLVIDEAHCVSEWGETFRPSYLELGGAIRELNPVVTTAFTATASPPVLAAVKKHLFGDIGAHLIQSVPDRPNITYSVLDAPSKLFALRHLLTGSPSR